MTASSISFGLLVVLLAILLLYKIRKLKPSAIGYGSQRMCPYRGLITSRGQKPIASSVVGPLQR
jgi:hypothetical protein